MEVRGKAIRLLRDILVKHNVPCVVDICMILEQHIIDHAKQKVIRRIGEDVWDELFTHDYHYMFMSVSLALDPTSSLKSTVLLDNIKRIINDTANSADNNTNTPNTNTPNTNTSNTHNTNAPNTNAHNTNTSNTVSKDDSKVVVGLSDSCKTKLRDLLAGPMYELAPHNSENDRAEIRYRSGIKFEEKTTDLFRCDKCGERKTVTKRQQKRAVDEPTTTMIRCVVCANTWKLSSG